MSVSDELRDRAARFGTRVAVRIAGVAGTSDAAGAVAAGSMTYAEWDRLANAVARRLSTIARRGDRVAVLMANDAACALQATYVAIQRAGAVAVVINPRYARREIEHIVVDSGAVGVVTTGDQRVPDGATRLDYDSLAAGDDSPFHADVRGDDLADIFYTSGTTGLPKGVASTHANAAHHSIPALEQGGTFLHAMPLSTFTGVIGAQLTPMRLAVTSVVQPRFDTARFAELIERERAMFVLMVPAQILLLLESDTLEGRDTSSVNVVMFGGAPTPPSAVEALAAAFPRAALTQGYGLTEGGNSVCVLPAGEATRRPGSVGRPMPGVRLRIVDDAGREVPAGEVGEVTLELSAGRRSYHNDPEATARTWRDGWVYTGDLGRVDDDGYLYIVDRKKDLLLRGGYNIYSVEVESALFEHPDVVEAAVVGVPHRVLGQDVCAIVRLRHGAEALTLEAVQAFVADRLADYKHPRRLVVRDEPLPRTGMGKVDKKRLLAELT
jgi:acyl-CoA synthetase (AMP-forming)/AMP-acid ligase II